MRLKSSMVLIIISLLLFSSLGYASNLSSFKEVNKEGEIIGDINGININLTFDYDNNLYPVKNEFGLFEGDKLIKLISPRKVSVNNQINLGGVSNYDIDKKYEVRYKLTYLVLGGEYKEITEGWVSTDKYFKVIKEDILEEIIEAVELAEHTKTQEDVDCARGLVGRLPESKEKDDLSNRLDTIQKEIDEKNAYDDIENAIRDMTNPSEAKDIQKDIDDLKDGKYKNRLQEKLNKKIKELEEAEKDNTLEEATKAVKIAEVTKNQEDVNSARDKVNKLLASHIKNELTNRLDIVEREIGNAELLIEARKAVKEAEETILLKDVNSAYGLVNMLIENEEKTKLLNRLKVVEKEITKGLAIEKLEKDAVTAVDVAEIIKRETYVERAKVKVEELEEGELKNLLNDRISRLEESLDLNSDNDKLKKARNMVNIAEILRREPYISDARDEVNKLEPSLEKVGLILRLDKIEGIV